MVSEKTKKWLKAAEIRAGKTMAQTAVALLPAAATITAVDWVTVIGTAALAGVASIFTSVAGLPEVKGKTFGEALEALKAGKKIKLAHWTGYWQMEDGKVMMHCRDGSIINLQDSKDIIYTLGNIASDEWEVVEEEVN